MTGGRTKGIPIARITDPNDPRHGSTAGRAAHQRMGETPCDPCKAASSRWRNERELGRRPGLVPRTGVVRRVNALQALGWTHGDIAKSAGMSTNALRKAMEPSGTGNLNAGTAKRVGRAFRALSMKTPPDDTRHRIAKTMAANCGYVPPLAWDDIDNDAAPVKSAVPSKTVPRMQERLDILEAADVKGKTASQVAGEIGVSLEGLNRWCNRHGHMDLYWRLLDRDPRFNGNQHRAA